MTIIEGDLTLFFLINMGHFFKEVKNNFSDCAEIVLKFGCIIKLIFKFAIKWLFSREFESLRPHQSEFYRGVFNG